MPSEVVCLRPEDDFLKVGVTPPDSLSIHYLSPASTGEYPVEAGDTILVPAGELHVTRNTGKTPLRMLCFFPTSDCSEQK